MKIQIERLKEIEPPLLEELVGLEKEMYGGGGFDQWTLPVFARYGCLFILKEDDRVIGSAELLKAWDETTKAYLAGFAIKVEQRGRGLGKVFLADIIKNLKDEGCNTISLTVAPDNIAASMLYRSHFGFKQVEYCSSLYGIGKGRAVLELKI